VDLVKLEHVVKVRGKHFNGGGNGRASHGSGGGRASSSSSSSGANSGNSSRSRSHGAAVASGAGLLPRAPLESTAPSERGEGAPIGVHFAAPLPAESTYGSGASAPGVASIEANNSAEGVGGVPMNGEGHIGHQQYQQPVLLSDNNTSTTSLNATNTAQEGGAPEAINAAFLELFCVCRRPSYGEMVSALCNLSVFLHLFFTWKFMKARKDW